MISYMQARQKNIDYRMEVAEHTMVALEGHVLKGDKNKLAQVVRNMISNAIKFTPEGGSVVIKVDLRKSASSGEKQSMWGENRVEPMPWYDTLVVEVVDSGHGISEVRLYLLCNVYLPTYEYIYLYA